MRNGLKIYACSGLCSNIGTAPADFSYWRDDMQTISSTRAVNALIASINLLEAQLQYKQLTDEEVLSALNQIDLYVVCLIFAQQLSQEDLPRAGRVIAEMIEEGKFQYASMEDAERDEHLVEICHEAQARYTAGDDPKISNNFSVWFDQHVTGEAFVGLTEEQQARAKQAMQSTGVGATGDPDAADMLFNAGEYYLYLYMTRSEAYACSKTIGKKWDKQKETYTYVHRAYDAIYGSPEAVDKIIYCGICKQLKRTPEYAIQELSGYKSKGIGDAGIIEAVAALITAIVTAIVAVLSIVVSIVQAKYQAPSAVESGTPEDYEWEDPNVGKGKLTTKATIGLLAICAAAGAAIFSLWKHKK